MKKRTFFQTETPNDIKDLDTQQDKKDQEEHEEPALKRRKIEPLDSLKGLDETIDEQFQKEMSESKTKKDQLWTLCRFGKPIPFSVKKYIPFLIEQGLITDKVIDRAIEDNLPIFQTILNSNIEETLMLPMIKRVEKFKFLHRFSMQEGIWRINKVPIELIHRKYKKVIRTVMQIMPVSINISDWDDMLRRKDKEMLLFFRKEMYQHFPHHMITRMITKYNIKDVGIIEMVDFLLDNRIMEFAPIMRKVIDVKSYSWLDFLFSKTKRTDPFFLTCVSDNDVWIFEHFHKKSANFPDQKVLEKVCTQINSASIPKFLLDQKYVSNDELEVWSKQSHLNTSNLRQIFNFTREPLNFGMNFEGITSALTSFFQSK